MAQRETKNMEEVLKNQYTKEELYIYNRHKKELENSFRSMSEAASKYYSATRCY